MVEKVLVLGDRGLVSFTHMTLLMDRKLEGYFRVPQKQVLEGRGNAAPAS